MSMWVKFVRDVFKDPFPGFSSDFFPERIPSAVEIRFTHKKL